MASSVLQATSLNRGLILDPRTKIVLLIAMSVFVLGGLGSENLPYIVPVLCCLPLALLLSAKKIKQALIYLVLFSMAYLTTVFLLPLLSGLPQFLMLACSSIVCRFMPSIMLGAYVVSTTTVSEFSAAMQRLHVSENIVIPLSVMFRFFPTVAEEFKAINAAMSMRGISFGGGNAAKMLEYRLVPLMTCSAKIGEELSAAALTRGLCADVKRTNICRIGFGVQDYLLIALCAVLFIVSVALYVIAW